MNQDSKGGYKRPGPRLSACQWCGKVSCNHCRCTGQENCNHAPGEMCKNPRYKRRLVCNPCEKNKLRHRQVCQQNEERKREAAMASNPEFKLQGAMPMDPMAMSRNEVLSYSYYGSSPNIAVMFFKTNTLLSLIPISSVQGSLSQLRSILNNLMLLAMNAHFVFIKGSSIISITDEATIPAQDIVQEYSFQYPINCNSCFFIHYYQQKMVPMTQQSLSPIANQMQAMWQTKPRRQSASSVMLQPLQSDAQAAQTARMESIPPADSSQAPPYVQQPDVKQFVRMSVDSAQWNSMPMNESMMPASMLFPRQAEASSSLNPIARPSDARPSLTFHEEAMSNDMAGIGFPPRNSSYGDMSYLFPYSNRLLPRASASSDMNWPVFSRHVGVGEDRPSYPLTEEVPSEVGETARGGEEAKREKAAKNDGEAKNDRMSLMMSIAKQELNAGEKGV